MPPLRVTLVEFAPSGGLFQFGYQLGLGLAERGHDVELLTGHDPEFPSRGTLRVVPALSTWHPHRGSEHHRAVRKLRRGARGAHLTLAWLQAVRHLRRRDPDLVLWAEWRFPIDAWGALFARLVVRRAVMMDLAHTPRPFSEQRTAGSLYKSGRALETSLGRAYAAMDAVLVLGERARQDLLEAFPDLSAVYVLDHGDEGILASEAVQPPSSAPPAALFFGTLARYKGLDTLLTAWPEVQRAVPDARLVIAGATVDIDPNQLRQMARDAGDVELRVGYVPAREVPDLFAAARVLVAPYHVANASGVVRLAHGFGRPALVTDVGDLAAAVRHEETGLAVAPGDAAALADGLVRLLSDPEGCDRQGAAGQAELERTGRWSGVADQVLAAWAARATAP